MSTKVSLLVDNSNTRTKFMRASGGVLLDDEQKIIPTSEISPDSVKRLLQSWDFDDVVLSSVVPAALKQLESSFDVSCHVLSANSPLGFDIEYPKPFSIGADRLANCIAAASLSCTLPCVVIDAGTAITFDVLKQNHNRACFIGGSIAPGLGAFVEYLSRNTALLPAIDPRVACQAIGQSTQGAIESAAQFGFPGMVRGILAAIEQELGQCPQVVATGGDSALLAAALPCISRLEPILLFHGLAALSGRIL